MESNDFYDNGKKLHWYSYLLHLGYYIIFYIKDFFREPFKIESKDLNILDEVQMLLETECTEKNIEQCKELSKLHRMVENTKARRRLEKWSLRVIAIYLIAVFLVVVTTYIRPYDKILLNIPETVMITILSTTTINIIGLGFIVLRGHFLADKMSEREEKNKL